MNAQEVKSTFRSPNLDDYPELKGYTREQIYNETIGGGALYLAAKMVRSINLKPGDVVLDLGCGKGATSMFLARHFGVQVVAVDWWTPATYLNERFTARGYRDRVVPLNLDITQSLPFAEGYFDAIFSMNSFSFYGGSIGFLQHLLKHLRRDGLLCVGSEVLSDEFTAAQLQDPPYVYSFKLSPPNENVDVFEDDFKKQHTPDWWKNLFESSGLLQVLSCQELEDAEILYEGLVLYNIEHGLDPEDVEISIAQLEYGREHRPRKSLFTITARKW